MGRFRTETEDISITFTTDGEVINRITGSSSSGGMRNEILIAYLEQFAGLKIQPINKYQLLEDIKTAVDKHISYDRGE